METMHKAMNLTFSIEDKNGNKITCPSEDSPDSVQSSSSWSYDGSDSPADVEMEEATSKRTLKTICFDTFMCTDKEKTSSSENSCSVSSSEMVMRGSSFILHETDQPLSVSLLGESKTSLEISPDVGVLSGMLPDVCEGLQGEHSAKVSNEPKYQGLECTYILPSCNQTFLIEENLIQMPSCLSDSQGETEEKARLLSVGKHECVTPIHQNSSKNVQKLSCNTGGSNHSTPVDGKTILLMASEDLDLSGNAQTSTPVQSLSNKTFCLPPLSDSPLEKNKGDSVSPMAQVINKQQGAAPQKPKSLMAACKTNKGDVKKFPKPNFGNIKSKIMSRATNFKTSLTQNSKASSNVLQGNEIQTMENSDARKSTPNKSTSAVNSTSYTPSQTVKSSNAAKRTRSSTCQENGPASKFRPRRWSESATSFKTAKDGSQEKNPRVNGILNRLATPKALFKGSSQNQTGIIKTPDGSESSKEDTQGNESLKARGKNLKSSVLAVSAKSSAETPICEWSKSKLGPHPSPARKVGASGARVPAANLRPPLSAVSKLKLGVVGKDESNNSDMPSPRVQLCTSDGRAQSRPTQSTATLTPSASKLPIKPKTQPKSSNASRANGYLKQEHPESSVGASSIPSSNRAMLLRSKLQSPSAKGVTSGAGCKNTSSTSSKCSRPSISPLKMPNTPRSVRPAATPTVDKNKSRTASRNLQPPTNGQPDLVPPESKSRSVEYYKALCEKKNQTIQQLENTVRSNNRRFEAVAVVIKHLYVEHEEVMKQRKERSQELITLREELVSSAQSCERLEQEKEDLRSAFDGVLQKVQEQHRLDLADLEERLKTFYSTEWEKVHQNYQDEADKCKAQMEQQLEDLRSKHEALKKELEVSHIEEVESLKNNFEESFKELKQSHEKELEILNTTLRRSEETLSSQIQELITENNNLKEKLKAEEKRRKDLAEKTQDSHILYLEQELESLKVVLDIKNKQIHEHDKKVMHVDKLMEKNVKLDEYLKKLQQENEDLKARMDKHAALSRQLSTEQAVLQQSLQKESKVNKRLSMENEELLWKLTNGDLSSPRKVSPSTSLTLQSPRNSGIFTSPPVSPR
ncbi:microtubule-associated tumor suppressor 1 homolog A isoform X1 [Paramisgurnus dabryanus]|uniref:microtubule-associated tumor suppressor 1 homolog A isoform X1 n=1 Tax=Paramisgurnus dabryanus TaxID=90735 RepID=UPI0031F4794F